MPSNVVKIIRSNNVVTVQVNHPVVRVNAAENKVIKFPGATTKIINNTNKVEILGRRGPKGEGVPEGGDTGQVLKKVSDDDFDTVWADEEGGVTDHGALTGLSDDDHPQYHNDTRGDIRYYTKAQIDTALANYLLSTTAASTYVSLSGSYSNPAWITSLAWGKITGTPTTLAGYGITDAIPTSYIDTDGTLSANSDTKLATQKAVKTYADQLIAAADAMVFKGVINCSSNPNYPAANAGWCYRVSVAGKIGGASGINVEIGDLLLCLTDGTASGNQATVGTNWSIAQTNIDGAVVGPASAVNNNFPAFDLTTGKLIKDSGFNSSSFILSTALDTDGTLAANSDTRVASQKATKTYADTKIPAKTSTAGLTATGSNQAGALGLTLSGDIGVFEITAGASNTGVRLPASAVRSVIIIWNHTTTNKIIYPISGGTINNNASNAGITLTAQTGIVLYGVSTTVWMSNVLFNNQVDLQTAFNARASVNIGSINPSSGGNFSINTLNKAIYMYSADGALTIYGDSSQVIYWAVNASVMASLISPYIDAGLTRGKIQAIRNSKRVR